MVRRIAFAGKGGVGKTTLAALLGDWLARQGRDVTLIDADAALSLGSACGLAEAEQPVGLTDREDLARERIGHGAYLSLTPRWTMCRARCACPCLSVGGRMPTGGSGASGCSP